MVWGVGEWVCGACVECGWMCECVSVGVEWVCGEWYVGGVCVWEVGVGCGRSVGMGSGECVSEELGGWG